MAKGNNSSNDILLRECADDSDNLFADKSIHSIGRFFLKNVQALEALRNFWKGRGPATLADFQLYNRPMRRDMKRWMKKVLSRASIHGLKEDKVVGTILESTVWHALLDRDPTLRMCRNVVVELDGRLIPPSNERGPNVDIGVDLVLAKRRLELYECKCSVSTLWENGTPTKQLDLLGNLPKFLSDRLSGLRCAVVTWSSHVKCQVEMSGMKLPDQVELIALEEIRSLSSDGKTRGTS